MDILEKSELQQALLAFGVAYYILTIIWAEVRKEHPTLIDSVNRLSENDKRQVHKGRAFRALSLFFIADILCFSLYPFIYKSFIPVGSVVPLLEGILPVIKITGIVCIAISLIWTVWTQIDVEQELHISTMNRTQIASQQLMLYSNRILSGHLLMFVGISCVLTNAVTAILLLAASMVYTRR